MDVAGTRTRGRRWGVRVAAVAVALLLVAPMARGVLWDRDSGPWGAKAEEWSAQYLLVMGKSDEYARVVTRFYAPGTQVDVRAQTGVRMGLSSALLPRASGFWPAAGIDGVRRQGVYVGADGVVLLLAAPLAPPFVPGTVVLHSGSVTGIPQGRPRHYAVVLELTREGISAHTELAAVDTWGQAPRRCDEEAVGRLERLYATVWAEGDVASADLLYDSEAVLVDAATGRREEGVARIGARAGELARSRGSPDQLSLRGAAGDALYVTCDPLEQPDRMVLRLQRLDRAGCPVEYVADLHVDSDGRVVREQWFSSTESARRCLADARSEDGVWADVTVPSPLAPQWEDRLERHDQVVTLVDPEPGLADQLEWALRRYEEAGLRAPVVRRVTWVDRGDSACEVVNGQAMSRRTEGFEVTLCFDRADACRDPACTSTEAWTRSVLLHELAHVWLAQNSDPSVEAAYLEHARLRQWSSAATRYHLRGVERACWDIAAGLMDEPRPEPPADRQTCDWYDDGFRILTGVAPLVPTCA